MDNLLHLVQAYLYEGWDEYEYDTWRDAVDDFARRAPARVPVTIGEIDEILASGRSDDELWDLLNVGVVPDDPDQGATGWLRDVQAHLVAVQDHSSPTDAR